MLGSKRSPLRVRTVGLVASIVTVAAIGLKLLADNGSFGFGGSATRSERIFLPFVAVAVVIVHMLLRFACRSRVTGDAFAVSQQRNQSILMNPNPAQVAGSAVGQDLSQTGTQITRRNLNVQPTIKAPAGYKFTVRVNRDMLFESPYEPFTDAASRR